MSTLWQRRPVSAPRPRLAILTSWGVVIIVIGGRGRGGESPGEVPDTEKPCPLAEKSTNG